jgi:hypothetical protein
MEQAIAQMAESLCKIRLCGIVLLKNLDVLVPELSLIRLKT